MMKFFAIFTIILMAAYGTTNVHSVHCRKSQTQHSYGHGVGFSQKESDKSQTFIFFHPGVN